MRGREIGMIFQDPMSALSPLHTMGRQLVETVLLHRPVSATRRRGPWANRGWAGWACPIRRSG